MTDIGLVDGHPPVENIHERVRNDILLGQLRPGQKLKLEALRGRYDASVSTLREVLSRLVSQGLVVNEEQKGFAVAPATLDDLTEITEARLLIEVHAARLSIAKGDLDWEATLVAAHYKLAAVEAALPAEPSRYAVLLESYNRDFHLALISACGSRWLMHLHSLMYDQSRRYRALSFKVRDFPRARSRDEHAELLQAALRRDADQVATLLEQHILKGAELYRAHHLDLGLQDDGPAPRKAGGERRTRNKG